MPHHRCAVLGHARLGTMPCAEEHIERTTPGSTPATSPGTTPARTDRTYVRSVGGGLEPLALSARDQWRAGSRRLTADRLRRHRRTEPQRRSLRTFDTGLHS